MGELISDDHYIHYCGQEYLRRNGVVLIVNKRVQNKVLRCNLKNDRMVSVSFQGNPFNITVIQVYASMNKAEEAEVEWFHEDLQDLLELTPPKDVLFIIWDWIPRSKYFNIEFQASFSTLLKRLFALETSRDHSVIFEIAPKYCI